MASPLGGEVEDGIPQPSMTTNTARWAGLAIVRRVSCGLDVCMVKIRLYRVGQERELLADSLFNVAYSGGQICVSINLALGEINVGRMRETTRGRKGARTQGTFFLLTAPPVPSNISVT